jgi:small subunit ribosomal protein S19e
VKDVKAEDFIKAFADYLKKSGKFELPSWADMVKTGVAKEMCPQNPDWYFVRAGD